MMYRFSLAQACRQILLVFAGLVIPIPLHPAVPAQERDALIALYNSTDGANWKKKTHWLGAVGTECTWYGVRCNDTGSSITSLTLGFSGLGGNQLRGRIPAQLGNLTNLQSLDLSANELSGSIPFELGNLRNLQNLTLSHNQLRGRIPTQLGNLTKLYHLNLSYNQLSGSIPAQLGSLPKLIRDLTISYNALYTNDSSLISSLNSKSPDWRNTQTIAPVGLAAAAQSISSIQVSWTPIVYSSGPGRYIVLRSTSSGGPYSPAGSTADKSASSLTITGLRPSTTYYFVVQTVTDPHAKNRNTVTSEYSSEVSAATY